MIQGKEAEGSTTTFDTVKTIQALLVFAALVNGVYRDAYYETAEGTIGFS